MMKRSSFILITGLFLLLLANSVSAQSIAIKKLRAQNRGGVTSYYLYESMIRAAVKVMGDSSLIELTEGARLVVYCSANKSSEDYDPERFERFNKDVSELGYQEMMSMKQDTLKSTVYQLEDDSSLNRYLWISDSPESWTVVELTGDVDIGRIIRVAPKLFDELENFSIPF